MYVPARATAVPIFVCMVNVFPKNNTDVAIITTLLTTLHTPWDTGVTRANVLKANWLYKWYSKPTETRGMANCMAPFSAICTLMASKTAGSQINTPGMQMKQEIKVVQA